MKFFLIVSGVLIIGYYIWKFSNRNWQELFTTQNVDHYMRIAGKLQEAKIKYKTTSGGEEFNFRKHTLNSGTPPISYTIWVTKEHFYKAQQLLAKKDWQASL